MSDYYELLQVPRNADEDAIKKSYRRLARQYHPDSNKAQIAAEHMKLLNAAYDVLSDPVKREEYDERLAAAARRPPTPPPAARAARSAPAGNSAPTTRRRSPTPLWMVWASITGVLVVATAAGTLFVMRDSVLALLPPPAAVETRLAGAPTALAGFTTATPAQPTKVVVASSTPAGAGPSPTPLRAVALTGTPTPGAYPIPVSAITGTRFVYGEFLNGNGPSDVFVSNAAGTLKANLTNTSDRSEVSPSWAPFGQRIVFGEFASGNLFVMNGDGSQLTQLTADPELYDSNPVWAPIGSLIAMDSILRSENDRGNAQMAKVYVVDFGSKARHLVADLPGRDLTWSPDAKWLAFQVPSASGTTIYVAPVDHPNAPPFFFAVPHVRRMAWTLDSRQLVYEAFTRDTNRDGVIDERDQAELFIITLQPLAVQPLATRTTVVSPRGHFPGPPANGEYYPPVTSVVQPP